MKKIQTKIMLMVMVATLGVSVINSLQSVATTRSSIRHAAETHIVFFYFGLNILLFLHKSSFLIIKNRVRCHFRNRQRISRYHVLRRGSLISSGTIVICSFPRRLRKGILYTGCFISSAIPIFCSPSWKKSKSDIR